jgi:hypothetical protein
MRKPIDLNCIGTIDAEVRELEEKLKLAVEALEVVAGWKNAYPENVFNSLSNDAYRSMCNNAGISVDRVSAHVLRPFLKGYSELAEQTLQQIKESDNE